MRRVHKLSRREFLRLSAAAGASVAVGAPTLLTGCPGLLPPGHDVPGTPTLEPALVAAVKGDNLFTMTREVLDAVGGLDTIVNPGETVFIKPNFLSVGLGRWNPTTSGECTKPDILIALAEECLKIGAAEVIIGDGAQVERFAWEELTTVDGSTHLGAEAARLNAEYPGRVTLACLNSDSPTWERIPARRNTLGELYVSSLVARADRVISVPVIKNHRHTGLTLSMKNFVGVTPISHYGGGSEYEGRATLHLTGVEGCFLDIVEALRPDLVIIDGSICCEGYGPWVKPLEGRTVDLRERLGAWLLLASTDPVAADATAARVVGQEFTGIRHLETAYRQGLGQAQRDLITLEGAALDELRVDWAPLFF